MPEYPEVSTVKKVLEQNILNKKVIAININYSKILKNESEEAFKAKLVGEGIKKVSNYGKFLIISFTNYDLVVHLRMEGKLFYYEDDYIIKKHDHIIFTLNHNSYLVYNDVRKFGTFELYLSGEYVNAKNIIKLGKEPLDKTLDIKYLKPKLNNNKKIKQTLLDQTVINGLGNIYVDEILYLAHIDPTSISKNLNDEHIKNIISSMRKVIYKALEYNGTTIKSFSASDQIKGNYQDFLKVYKQESTPCSRCKTIIKKIKLNGRGTHFCPHCQRKI